jgi:hypothetical protein
MSKKSSEVSENKKAKKPSHDYSREDRMGKIVAELLRKEVGEGLESFNIWFFFDYIWYYLRA